MRVFTSKQLAVLSLLLLMTCSFAWAQQQSKLDIALRYIEQNREKWDLTETDIIDMVVNDQYKSDHNGVTHTYLIQRHASIEVYNAIMGVHITEDGRVAHATNRFIPSLVDKINSTNPSISAYAAIESAAAHLDLSIEEPLRLIKNENSHNFLYDGGNISHSKIKVKLAYQHMRQENTVRLAWNLAIDHPKTPDYWSMRVDALTGEILDQNNWTVYCEFHDEEEDHVEHDGCNLDFAYEEEDTDLPTVEEKLEAQNTNLMGGTYHVFPVPVMSPAHGDREIVEDPADPTASPFGWHDTNGEDGAEYTITRGNNVHAYLDVDADNTSNGDEPDGGDDLVFDFPFDETQEPSEYQEAAVTQLFYMNNYMHDFSYAYGFNEAAGNYQQNNYGNGGNGGDYVLANAQDGSGTNNATFNIVADGANGVMSMFLWSNNGGRTLTVNVPEDIAGTQFEARPGNFGGALSGDPITGDVVIVDDGSNQPTLGCNAIVNGDDITGKIAMIDRGVCEFGLKSLNAEEAGAIAVIICNFEEAVITMGGGQVGNQVTIPAIFMANSSCATLRQLINNGLNVSLQLPDSSGPSLLDGDFDNGIIAHEYAHGISHRLTGGRLNAGCLFNGEQMGEGWSDFFTLVTSVSPGDVGETPIGVGTYVYRQDNGGNGVRARPYSTDMSINEFTYGDIVGQGVHALGAIWASMLWDMYWLLVDKHGFDDDIMYGSGGNNMAVQLVMDGMKFQGCSPGFIDGRDAILLADTLNNGAENSCLIWEAFSRRGLGFSADQLSENNGSDGKEAFDSHPQCVKELKIAKTVTSNINAGDDVTVTLTINNHKDEDVTGVVVTDILPEGLTYVGGSSNIDPEVTGSTLTFNLGDMLNDDEIIITYLANSDPESLSLRAVFDDMENGDDFWEFDNLDGIEIWELNDGDAYSGDYAWNVVDIDMSNDQVLQNFEPITISGNQPILRFFQRTDTEYGFDGGILQILPEGAVDWEDLGDLMFRNSYNGNLAYSTFAIPNIEAFWGESDDFFPTYIDLSPYIGQNVQIRFRFGSNQVLTPPPSGAIQGQGWFIDDFEIMDVVNYNSEACITSEEGDMACAIAPEWGTIVESNGVTDVDDPEQKTVLAVYPNPANDFINVAITTENAEEITLELLSLDGKVIRQKALRTNGDYQLIPMAVQDLSAGFYFVRVSTATEIAVEKIVIK